MNGIEIQFTFLSFVYICAISIGCFVSVMLFFSAKHQIKANLFLGLFVLSFSLLQIWDVLIQTRLLIYFPHMILVINPLIYVLGPFMFLYITSLTEISWQFKLKTLYHFIPAILVYLIFIPGFFMSTENKVLIISQLFQNGKVIIPPIIFQVATAHCLIYMIYSFLKLNRHNNIIRKEFEINILYDINRLRVLFIFIFMLWTVFILRVIFYANLFREIGAVLTICMICLIGYFGFRHDIQNNISSRSKKLMTGNPKKKYATSPLTTETSKIAIKKLFAFMDNEKLYLNNNLKLNDVANKMNLPMYYISQIINEQLGKNFYDFLNDFRVNEAKKRIADKNFNHLTILAIGYDSGFNSKTAFYSAFKKVTGLTPSAFKKQLIKETA
jgi:AraC-like DNA-binding protein